MTAKVVPITSARPPSAVVEPYPFDPAFERAFIALLAQRPKLLSKVEKFVEVDALTDGPARLVYRAIAQITKDNGRGPDAVLVVLQRLRAWQDDGKVTAQQIRDVASYLDAAEDAGLPSEDSVIAEVAPILRKRVNREAIQSALTSYGRNEDISPAFERAAAAARIAESSGVVGTVLGPGSFDELERLRHIDRARTGILELDDALDGGPMRGTGNMFLGPTSAGKSVGLVQVAVAGALQGLHVAYATLELPVPVILARIKSNLTGVPINPILADPHKCGAAERLAMFQQARGFGRIVSASFTPKTTRVAEILDWTKALEDGWGAPVDLLVVDYADKVNGTTSKSDESTYHAQGNVYDQFYAWARDNGRWVWTASQAKRASERGNRLLDTDDVADSMGKSRNFDLVVTLNPRDEFTQMILFVAKNRLGTRGAKIGPMPVDFTRARLCPSVLLDEFTEALRLPHR